MQTDLLKVSEKIYYGIRDRDTAQSKFNPLWQYPILLESLLFVLKYQDNDHEETFKNVCSLVCPEFLNIMEEFG